MSIIAIDTDSNGYLCLLHTYNNIEFFKTPTEFYFVGKKKRKKIDSVKLYNLLYKLNTQNNVSKIILEKQSSRIGQSSVATFTFGYNFGIFVSVSELISNKFNTELILIHPLSWKRKAKLLGYEKNEIKSKILSDINKDNISVKGRITISASESYYMGRLYV